MTTPTFTQDITIQGLADKLSMTVEDLLASRVRAISDWPADLDPSSSGRLFACVIRDPKTPDKRIHAAEQATRRFRDQHGLKNAPTALFAPMGGGGDYFIIGQHPG